jgi:hypothetical protein
MAGLNLSYCQLIKIVLSQIGGNPLQQVYDELHKGLATIVPSSGLIPGPLGQVKALVDQVTNTIHAAQIAANDFSSTLQDIGGSFYQNPLGASLNTALNGIDGQLVRVNNLIVVWNNRIVEIDQGTDINGNPVVPDPDKTLEESRVTAVANKAAFTAERDTLTTARDTVSQYKENTDRLSGVTTQQSGASLAGGCSLQDLLGSGCAPNNDVPDIDLKQLLDSLKNKDFIDAFATKILVATGYADYQQELALFKITVDNLNSTFTNLINKAAIRNAVTAQLTQMVFNLMTGCGGQVLDLTLKSNIKETVGAWVALLQQQNASGNAYIDASGNVVTVSETTVNPLVTANISIKLV